MLLEENKPLAPFTTFGIGGPARWFVSAASEQDIVDASEWASSRSIQSFVLGGGSNLLVADEGFKGLVLHVALRGMEQEAGGNFSVAGGENWDDFVRSATQAGCAGIECLAGIPGTVGGTPVQNVGAYGQEVSSTIKCVRAYDLESREFVSFTAAECDFGYRRSRFNTVDRDRFVVTQVEYKLMQGGAPRVTYAALQKAFSAGATPTLEEVAAVVRRIRLGKGMLLVDGDPDCRSAGSFFKNPVLSADVVGKVAELSSKVPPQFPAGKAGEEAGQVKVPAAWLIEQAGFRKGQARGAAGISSRHTLALINRGDASAAEVMALAGEIRSTVRARFGVELEMEPVMLGF